jgi:lipoprotein-anchoring transpeptidase ErfK/SrfK
MYRVLLCALATSALATSLAHAEPLYSRTAPGVAPPVQQAPVRYAASRGNLGGGFIEAIFGGSGGGGQAYGSPYGQQDPNNPYGAQRYIPPESELSRFSVDPRFRRQLVEYSGNETPGTVIVDTPRFHLYLVQAGGKAIRYGVGVGRPGFTWSGIHAISSKREWPDWRPPDEMLRRMPNLPHFMAGGPQNPLGARALYLGSTLYRIHGSNEPWTIGTQVSSGCIRMRNEDVIDLYDRVPIGAKVVVL